MKRIISLVISILVVFSFCTPVLAYTDSECMEQAKYMLRLAETSMNERAYMEAGMYYSCAAISFGNCHSFHELAAHAYGLAADAYDADDSTYEADQMRESKKEEEEKALETGNQVPVNEIFNGNTLIEATGATLSEGNVTIIVGIASALIFGLVGFFIGMRKNKI